MRVSSHAGCRVSQQAFFQQMDERCFPNTGWTNHEHYRTRSAGQNLFSWSTNGFENGFERFQKSWMLNEATLLKILLAHLWWLQQQRSVKELRFLTLDFFLILGSFRLFLVHVRILLNTSNLSGFFSGGANSTEEGAGTSTME